VNGQKLVVGANTRSAYRGCNISSRTMAQPHLGGRFAAVPDGCRGRVAPSHNGMAIDVGASASASPSTSASSPAGGADVCLVMMLSSLQGIVWAMAGWRAHNANNNKTPCGTNGWPDSSASASGRPLASYRQSTGHHLAWAFPQASGSARGHAHKHHKQTACNCNFALFILRIYRSKLACVWLCLSNRSITTRRVYRNKYGISAFELVISDLLACSTWLAGRYDDLSKRQRAKR